MKLDFNGAGKACYRFADPVVSDWMQCWSLLHTKLVLWFCRWHVYVKRRCQILYTGQYINDLLTYSKYFMYVFLISIWKAIYIFRCVFIFLGLVSFCCYLAEPCFYILAFSVTHSHQYYLILSRFPQVTQEHSTRVDTLWDPGKYSCHKVCWPSWPWPAPGHGSSSSLLDYCIYWSIG